MPVELSRFYTPEPDTAISREKYRGLRRRDGVESAKTACERVLLAVCGVICFLLAFISVPV